MKNNSEESQEVCDSEQYSAVLQVLVDKDGTIEYNCDWDHEDGVVSLASIFYKILYDDLIAIVLEDIKDRCKEKNIQDYDIMIELINSVLEVENEELNNDEDPVVVSPDRISNIM
jgi:hypothetical protein